MIQLNSVELNHSNPSMGPHETRTEIRLSSSGFEEEFEKLLKETKINGVVRLEEYLQFHIDKNSEEIEKINKAYEPGDLSNGGTVSELVFNISSGPTVKLRDLRLFQIEGYYYKTFQGVLVENGSKHSYQPWDKGGRDFIDEPIPRKSSAKIKTKDEPVPSSPPQKPSKE